MFPQPKPQTSVRLDFKCLACDQTFKQTVKKIYCDMPTAKLRAEGKATPYSEFVIPERITCPHCRAVDQYELQGHIYGLLTGALLREQFGMANPGDALQIITMTVADGRVMHPLAARDWYARQVAKQPERVELRVRYGNVLRALGYWPEAEAEYRAALEADPEEIEALINLAALSSRAKRRTEGLDYLRRLVAAAPHSRHPQSKSFAEAAQDILEGRLKLKELQINLERIAPAQLRKRRHS
jgi:tetratricopeptide (TPR) repeat protein